MYVIVPIGHDESLRRIPWLTVGIMAVCTLVQVRSCNTSVDENELAHLELQQRAVVVDWLREALLGADGKYLTPEQLLLIPGMSGAPGAEQLALPPGAGAGEQAPGDEGEDRLDPARTAEALDKLRHLRARDVAAKVDEFRSGRGVAPDDPRRLRWLELQSQIERLLGADPMHRFGYRPAAGPSINMLLYAFVHGGWLHLLGNLLFLWLVGCNLEDRWGKAFFGAFYLVGAAGAALGVPAGAPRRQHVPGRLLGRDRGGHGRLPGELLRRRDPLRLLLPRAAAPGHVRGARHVRDADLVRDGPAIGAAAGVGWRPRGGLLGACRWIPAGRGHRAGAAAVGFERKRLLPASSKGVEWAEDPDVVQALDLRSRGRHAEAIALLRPVMVRSPRHATAAVELVRAAAEAGDRAVAEEFLERAVQSLTRDRRSVDLAELAAAVDKRWPMLRWPESALATTGRTLLQLGYLERAERCFRRVLTEFPDGVQEARLRTDLSDILERTGRLAESRELAESVIADFPDHALAPTARERLARLQGQSDVATPERVARQALAQGGIDLPPDPLDPAR